jgi:hypothetical protein
MRDACCSLYLLHHLLLYSLLYSLLHLLFYWFYLLLYLLLYCNACFSRAEAFRRSWTVTTLTLRVPAPTRFTWCMRPHTLLDSACACPHSLYLLYFTEQQVCLCFGLLHENPDVRAPPPTYLLLYLLLYLLR